EPFPRFRLEVTPLHRASDTPGPRPDGPVRSPTPPRDQRPPTGSRLTSQGRTSGHTRQLFVSAAASPSRSVPPAPAHQPPPGPARRGRTPGAPQSAPAPDLQPAAARPPEGQLPFGSPPYVLPLP